jgi:hypothetical protein
MNVNNNEDDEFFDAATTSNSDVILGGLQLQQSSLTQQSDQIINDTDSTTEVSGFGDFVDAFSGLESTSNDLYTATITTTNSYQKTESASFASFPSTDAGPPTITTTLDIETIDVSESSSGFGDFVEVQQPNESTTVVTTVAVSPTSDGFETKTNIFDVFESTKTDLGTNIPNLDPAVISHVDQPSLDDPFAHLGNENDPVVADTASTILGNYNDTDFMIINTAVNGLSPTDHTNRPQQHPEVDTNVSAASMKISTDPFSMEAINATDGVTAIENIHNVGDFIDFIDPTSTSVSNEAKVTEKGDLDPYKLIAADRSIEANLKKSVEILSEENAAQVASDDDFGDFGDFDIAGATSPLSLNPNQSSSPDSIAPVTSSQNDQQDGIPATNTDTIPTNIGEVFGKFDSEQSTTANKQSYIGSDLKEDDDFGYFDTTLEVSGRHEEQASADNIVMMENDTIDNGFTDFDSVPVSQTLNVQQTNDDFGNFDATPVTHTMDVQETNDEFGDFDAAPVTQTMDAQETDEFGDFGAVPVTHAIDEQQTNEAFGDFDAAPVSHISNVHQSNDEFGDFDAAPGTNTMDAQQTIDEFGDFDAAPVSHISNVQQSNDEFGDFDAAPGTHTFGVKQTEEPSVKFIPEEDRVADDDDFGDFDFAPERSEASEQQGTTPSTGTILESVENNGFGCFDSTPSSEQFSKQITDNDDSDDDFGDFDAAPTEASARVQSNHETDDDFGDFDTIPSTNDGRTDSSSFPSTFEPAHISMNDPILTSIRTLLPKYFSYDDDDVNDDNEAKGTLQVLETTKNSIEVLLVSLDFTTNKRITNIN